MIMINSNTTHALEEEWYIVRHSGEIPEIAYNSAIHYLTMAEEGPLMTLDEDQTGNLKKAALDRYCEIVTRDLIYENVNKPIYRGIRRSIHNYQRLCDFCSRQHLDVLAIREEAARLLPLFLETAISRVKESDDFLTINCTYNELQQFADALQVQLLDHPMKIKSLCQR